MARKKNQAVDEAYCKILNNILSFEFLPGDTISDFKLSKQLNMSRTPIREAITRLSMEGLITQGKTKMLVSCITPSDIQEICEVRTALETMAVKLIMKKGGLTNIQISTLSDLNEEMKKYVGETDYVSNFDTDDKLHNTLVEFSGNTRLVEYSNLMRMQIKRARWLTILRPRYSESILEHKEIIDALEAKNLVHALEALENHLRHAIENFNMVLSNGDMHNIGDRIKYSIMRTKESSSTGAASSG